MRGEGFSLKETTTCFPTLLMLKTIPEKFQAKFKVQHYEIALKKHLYNYIFILTILLPEIHACSLSYEIFRMFPEDFTSLDASLASQEF